MIRLAVKLAFAVVIFIVLIALTYLYNWINHRPMTKIMFVVNLVISLLISGVGAYITNPITNWIVGFADAVADRCETKHVEGIWVEITDYNCGNYTGDLLRGVPHGKGKLTYLEDNEHFYAITINGQVYKALYYEGEFKDGWRFGEGIVYYEGGFYEVGTFYGKWEKGKVVFEGRRYDRLGRYVHVTCHALNEIKARDETETEEWINTKQ